MSWATVHGTTLTGIGCEWCLAAFGCDWRFAPQYSESHARMMTDGRLAGWDACWHARGRTTLQQC